MKLAPDGSKVIAVLFTLGAAATEASSLVPIDLTTSLNDLTLDVSASSAGNRVMVEVVNQESRDVTCIARFINGPQTPVQRRGTIKPEKKNLFSAPLKRGVTRVKVELNCEAASAE